MNRDENQAKEKLQQEIINIKKEFLNVYEIQKKRIKEENIRRNNEYKKRCTYLTEQSQYNFSMFGAGSFMEKIGVTEEKLYNPMVLYNIFSGKNFEYLTSFISKLKEWQDRQFDYAKISLKIEIEDKIIEQENKRREIEAQIKKINDLEIKQLQGQNLTGKQSKDLNNSNEFIKSFNVVSYSDINKWEQNYKNKWLLEIKKNIDINRKKKLEQRKIANEMWECQLREINGEFDNRLRCCSNWLQHNNKITLEGLGGRLINSNFLDLADQQHQKEVYLNNQTNQNTVWIQLRDLESRWWKKSNKIYADSLKLIFQEMVSDIELIDLTSSPMDNTIFNLEAEPAEVAEQMLAQQAREKRKRKLQQVQNQKTIGNEQYARLDPVNSILNKYPCSKLGCFLPDLVCCSLTTGASTSTKVGDSIQTAPQAENSFDRRTIFKLEADSIKVAEQMLQMQKKEREVRQKAREQRQKEKAEQEREKRQQWLTE